MAFDLLLKNGTVVDGEGTPSLKADIGISGGRVAEIGKLNVGARRTIDIEGLVAAPGVIDVHSHYDAMVCWEPLLGSSSEHGTTTVVQGNCGIGIAPCKPEDREAVLQDLVTLEGIPYDALTGGVKIHYETFPEYLDALRKQGLGINVAAMVPLSPLRRYTLHDEATERASTPAEREEIAGNLRDAMKAGAIGYSGSFVLHQMGYKGRPLPSSMADRDELIRYASVLKEFGRGMIQAHVIKNTSSISDDEIDILTALSEASGGRFITYSGVVYRPDQPQAVEKMLQRAEPLRKRHILGQSMIRPITADVDFRNPYLLAGGVPLFKQMLNRDKEEQRRAYSDPAWREEARKQLADSGMKRFGETWKDGMLIHVEHEKMKPYLMRTIRQIAAERGEDALDVMLDLVLEDDFGLKLAVEFRNSDPQQLAEHIKDPRLIIGSADGGAHVDMMVESSFPTWMLGHFVRERKVITLEHAVARMTSEPADLIGLKDRGRLKPGKAADIMVFDPASVGSPRRADQTRHDLPGGGMRLYSSPTGMEYVFVNGRMIYDHNKATGELPGQILDGS